MTPVRTRTTGGPQSPRSGSPVRDQAMTPTWVCASRAANDRADAAEGHLDIASGLTLKPTARLNPIEVAIDVQLQQYQRMLGRAARRFGIGPAERWARSSPS